MQPIKKSLFEIRWVQEVLVFFILFILINLNAWHTITGFEDVAKAVTYFLILYVHVQLHRFILLPKLLNKGKYLLYIVCTGILTLIFSAILFLTDVYWIFYGVEFLRNNEWSVYFYHFGTCSLSLIAMLAPFLVVRYYQEQKKQAALQMAVNQMGLKNLTAQLNPHFLFNTFNNLYGISLNDPSRVPDIIMQVSKLMRYQLESNSKEWVTLGEELAFIESYIELEEERVGQRCEIKYEYEIDTADESFLIAPLLLISLIENAFKHGTNTIAGSFVYISILVKNAVFNMQITNSIPHTTNNGNYSTGIGLKNTKQRLDILYADKHKLTICPGPEKYSVDLILPLILR